MRGSCFSITRHIVELNEELMMDAVYIEGVKEEGTNEHVYIPHTSICSDNGWLCRNNSRHVRVI